MLDLTQPQKLQSAVDSLSSRTPLGTALRSAELERLPREIKQRAFFSAGVENMRMLETMKRALMKRLNRERRKGGEGTFQRRDQFLVEMQQLAERLGLRPKDEKRGSIQDIGSFRRLRLIWDTQVAMAQNYAKWKMGNDEDVLFAVPAQELVRVSNRRVPRDWQDRWLELMGTVSGTTAILTDDGRMIALKTDPIWIALSRFGLPYPPFDYNSGMGLKNVRRREAVRLGLIGKNEEQKPADQPFSKAYSVSGKGLNLKDVKDYFGDMVAVDKRVGQERVEWNGEKLDKLIERAGKRVSGEVFDKKLKGVSFGRVDRHLADKAAAIHDIEDFKLSLTEDGLFHILTKHGVLETRSDQRAITADDFYELLTIWRRPVRVLEGNKPRSLEFHYEHNGQLIAAVWNQYPGEKALTLNSMYAKKEVKE